MGNIFHVLRINFTRVSLVQENLDFLDDDEIDQSREILNNLYCKQTEIYARLWNDKPWSKLTSWNWFLFIIHKKTSKEIGDGGCYDNTKYIKYKTLDILSPDVHHSVVDVNITAKCLMFRPLNCHNNQASLKLQLHGCKV